MRFNVKDSNIFYLPNNTHMLHLATITYGLREFIVMICLRGPKKGNVYIEEVVLNSVNWTEDVFANCKFIADDNLANDLSEFANSKGLLDPKRILNEVRAH